MMDWTNTKAEWDGEDWRFTEVPLEACPNWGGRTCFSRMELNYEGADPKVALAALKYWVEHGESWWTSAPKITLWHVKGIPGQYWDHKMDCEAAARKAFPDEGADSRYARVFYTNFFKEE